MVGGVATLGVPGTNLQKPEPYELPSRPHLYKKINIIQKEKKITGH